MTKPEPSLLETLDTPEVRPLVRSVVVYVVLWYSLYITAWAPAALPLWALDWIEQLKSTFGALVTAARLSEHPFPTQVMILYAFVSTPLLGLYWVYYCFVVHRFAQVMYRGVSEQLQQTGIPIKTRLLFAAVGVATLSCCWYIFPVQSLMGGAIGTTGVSMGGCIPPYSPRRSCRPPCCWLCR